MSSTVSSHLPPADSFRLPFFQHRFFSTLRPFYICPLFYSNTFSSSSTNFSKLFPFYIFSFLQVSYLFPQLFPPIFLHRFLFQVALVPCHFRPAPFLFVFLNELLFLSGTDSSALSSAPALYSILENLAMPRNDSTFIGVSLFYGMRSKYIPDSGKPGIIRNLLYCPCQSS